MELILAVHMDPEAGKQLISNCTHGPYRLESFPAVHEYGVFTWGL